MRIAHVLSVAVLLAGGCSFTVAPGTQSAPEDGPPADVAVDTAQIDAAIDAVPCEDVDNDNLCDDVDAWLCGAAPAAPASTVSLNQAEPDGDERVISLTGTKLDNGANLRTVARGATVMVNAGYSIFDCICTGCVDQIQVGIISGTARSCIYDGNPGGGASCEMATTGNGMVTVVAPMTPGVYSIGFRLGQALKCSDGTTWWDNQPPPAAQVVAKICVR